MLRFAQPAASDVECLARMISADVLTNIPCLKALPTCSSPIFTPKERATPPYWAAMDSRGVKIVPKASRQSKRLRFDDMSESGCVRGYAKAPGYCMWVRDELVSAKDKWPVLARAKSCGVALSLAQVILNQYDESMCYSTKCYFHHHPAHGSQDLRKTCSLGLLVVYIVRRSP